MNPPQEINFVPNLPVKMSEKQLQNGLCASLKRQLPTYRYILPITNTLIVKILAICDTPPGSYRIAQYGHPPYRFHPLVADAAHALRRATAADRAAAEPGAGARRSGPRLRRGRLERQGRVCGAEMVDCVRRTTETDNRSTFFEIF